MRRCVRAIVPMLLILFSGAGCSTPALKSTPLWDGELGRASGPPEERINIWPLFYYREPATSILWPLFSRTDEGHALVPLYEYSKADDQLRMLSVAPWLPAGAVRTPNYLRVLNASRDRQRDRLTVFPVFLQSPDELMVLPFLYRSPDGFWTPLLTRFADRHHNWSG